MNQISWSDPQPRQMRVQEETTSSEVLGHIVDENGIRADPEKMSAIVKMKAPTNISELHCFMGMTNKFSHNLAQPL